MMLQETYLDSHTYEQLADTTLITMHYIHPQGLWLTPPNQSIQYNVSYLDS